MTESATQPDNGVKCITDALAHAVTKVQVILDQEKLSGEASASSFYEESLSDVDGDAEPEMLLVEMYLGTANNPHFLSLSNQGCRRYGGFIWASAESIEVLPEIENGFRMLQAFGKSGCAGLEGVVERLAWTGERYDVKQQITTCPTHRRAR